MSCITQYINNTCITRYINNTCTCITQYVSNTCITSERHIHHFIYNKMTARKGDLHALFTIP